MTALAVNPNDFLHSLATWMIARANLVWGLSLSYTTTPLALVRNLVTEGKPNVTVQVADPVTGMAAYPGSPLLHADRIPQLNLQLKTSGTDDEACFSQAQLFFETFTDANGAPLRMVTINGFKSIDNSSDGTWLIRDANPLQRPGMINRDERGRPQYVFNVRICFKKAS